MLIKLTAGALEGQQWDNPPKQEGFHTSSLLTFSPCLYWLTVFSLLMHFTRVSVTTDSMRLYLDSTEVTQVDQLLQDGTSKFAVSLEHGGDSWRQTVTLEELDRAAEGP